MDLDVAAVVVCYGSHDMPSPLKCTKQRMIPSSPHGNGRRLRRHRLENPLDASPAPTVVTVILMQALLSSTGLLPAAAA
jgi:hypothetical protein